MPYARRRSVVRSSRYRRPSNGIRRVASRRPVPMRRRTIRRRRR